MSRRRLDDTNEFINEVYKEAGDKSQREAYEAAENRRKERMFSSFNSFQESRRRIISQGKRVNNQRDSG